MQSDTIAAIATGGGISAVGIIRVSGENAIRCADAVFCPYSGTPMSSAPDRKLCLGELHGENGRLLDVCLCSVTRAPGGYTGEDTAELYTHGSPVVMAEALKTLFRAGARQALAGEFTKRAFLNGRMDLTQAEAVIDLIEAETKAAAENAAFQLGGAVRTRIESVYVELTDIAAHFHAVIDYPDEDIEDFALEGYMSLMEKVVTSLERLLSTFERGDVIKNGVAAVIAGRPNVGKSSLLNALLGYERAIVTETAGTTRDTIEEKIRLGGVLLRLTDTAGIRETEDAVEILGVERARGAIKRARLALIVLDGSEPLCDEDRAVLSSIPEGTARIAVINKSDLPVRIDVRELEKLSIPHVYLSALTGDGLDALEAEIGRLFPLPEDTASPVLTNPRQFDAISRARDSVGEALSAARDRVTPDAVLTELESALSALGEVTGRVMREDIVSRIFERFCVGK